MELSVLILGFHSRDQQPCFSTKTKEDVSIIIAFNSRRIGSGHQHGRHFIVWGHQHGGRDVMWNPRILVWENVKTWDLLFSCFDLSDRNLPLLGLAENNLTYSSFKLFFPILRVKNFYTPIWQKIPTTFSFQMKGARSFLLRIAKKWSKCAQNIIFILLRYCC